MEDDRNDPAPFRVAHWLQRSADRKKGTSRLVTSCCAEFHIVLMHGLARRKYRVGDANLYRARGLLTARLFLPPRRLRCQSNRHAAHIVARTPSSKHLLAAAE